MMSEPLTPLQIAELLNITITGDEPGERYEFSFSSSGDQTAFLELCDEQASYALVPTDNWFNAVYRVAWWVE